MTCFPHRHILNLTLSSWKMAWKNTKLRAFLTQNIKVMGEVSRQMGWVWVRTQWMDCCQISEGKWGIGCVAGEQWWWASWMVACPGFLKFFPKVLITPNSCRDCWCCSPVTCYIQICLLIFQTLEGCKPVLTTISISATSLFTFMYIWCHSYIILFRILSS